MMTIHQLHKPGAAAALPDHADLTIKIVENEDERFKAMLVRAIVYMHEQLCPYSEEFDLNDHAATQIVGLTATGEPVLTARLRYFNGFAKIERLAIRKEYRGLGYAHRLLSFLLDLGRTKGFSHFYLHAQARLRGFYEGYGFRPVGSAFSFSDHDYIEMELSEQPQLVSPSMHIGSTPMVLNRPENSTQLLGPLEHGAFRSAKRIAATERSRG
ncbi:GNAT family N-acetyltransferase [Jeongeupia naejangsanensis]|uniref:GNAT family N-acetyltransferase n=1 Tax=Jeongeupia naejangsanensis TaxID=613195 RepID=A0ABS2BHM8_9NEIS|nr:GNAT family N-acetyltransferase [Jeongeupia naejangsanensis]MBM3115111.1 GNAT family N-acetyltransferase [Jeongeupia naejangsanensis]